MANGLYGWTSSNTLEIIAAGIVTSYGCIAYQMYAANQIIFDPLAWSNWQGNTSLEQLFTIPQATLEADILYTFQHRHIDICNPTDFMYSLVQSAISLQHEIYVIQAQIVRYEWIAKCRSLRLFFIKDDALEILKEKHKKLLFMKHIFASWCARYKIEKNS